MSATYLTRVDVAQTIQAALAVGMYRMVEGRCPSCGKGPIVGPGIYTPINELCFDDMVAWCEELA
jgi:hypothetical protein